MKTRLIKELRDRLNVTEEMVPDDKILSMTDGSILRTAAEVSLNLQDISACIAVEGKKLCKCFNDAFKTERRI